MNDESSVVKQETEIIMNRNFRLLRRERSTEADSDPQGEGEKTRGGIFSGGARRPVLRDLAGGS